MKIAAVAMVYNEALVLPYFLRHYRYLDEIRILYETDTTDESLKVLAGGPNVVVENCHIEGGLDDIEKIRLINEAVQGIKADWVYVVDPDEFVFPPGNESPHDFLGRQSCDVVRSGMYQVYRHRSERDLDPSFAPVPQRVHGDPDLFSADTRADRASNNLYIKPNVVRPTKNIRFLPGHHRIEGNPRASREMYVGAHWQMADPSIAISRRMARKERISERNRARKMGSQHFDVSVEKIKEECERHLDDPIIDALASYSEVSRKAVRRPASPLRKFFYRAGLLTPFWQVDRTRYLKRLAKQKVDDWRYAAKDDVAQFFGDEVVARLSGVSTPVFFYCNRKSSSIEADILKSSNAKTGVLKQRWRVLELGMDLISPGSRVIDVGASIGVYALPWAAAVADVTVHCFEPNPAVRSRLARNVALNRLTARVRLHAEALSDRSGVATLYASDDMSSLNEGAYSGAGQAVPVAVSVARLDDIVAIGGPRISLIKIDVQGYELEVLQGAGSLISQHRPALLLEHEDDLYLHALEVTARKASLAKLLSGHGYETLYISRWGADLLTVADWSRHLNGDLLALPVDGLQRDG